MVRKCPIRYRQSICILGVNTSRTIAKECRCCSRLAIGGVRPIDGERRCRKSTIRDLGDKCIAVVTHLQRTGLVSILNYQLHRHVTVTAHNMTGLPAQAKCWCIRRNIVLRSAQECKITGKVSLQVEVRARCLQSIVNLAGERVRGRSRLVVQLVRAIRDDKIAAQVGSIDGEENSIIAVAINNRRLYRELYMARIGRYKVCIGFACIAIIKERLNAVRCTIRSTYAGEGVYEHSIAGNGSSLFAH